MNPSRICRTIVVGQQASVVRRILFILSYFIRCNEVFEHNEELSPTESGSFFGVMHDIEEDRVEDLIARQLTSSSSESKGIAIPKKKIEGRMALSPPIYPDAVNGNPRRRSTPLAPVSDSTYVKHKDSLKQQQARNRDEQESATDMAEQRRSLLVGARDTPTALSSLAMRNSKTVNKGNPAQSTQNETRDGSLSNGVNSHPLNSASESTTLSSSPVDLMPEIPPSNAKNGDANPKPHATEELELTSLQRVEAFSAQHIDLECCLAVPMPK